MKKIHEIQPADFREEVFRIINDDWFLITSGEKDDFNAMTASWGTFGIYAHKPIATVFVRPSRHTFQFIQKHKLISLSFFTAAHHQVLQFCGTHSGKDTDKIDACGLTPLITDLGSVYFEEARLVVEGQILYSAEMHAENFHTEEILSKIYPKGDFHHIIMFEIKKMFYLQ